MKKDDTWNIGCMVNDSFVPANQQTSVLYCRLTNFTSSPASIVNDHLLLWLLLRKLDLDLKQGITIHSG